MIKVVRTGLVTGLVALTAGCVDTPRTAGGLQLGLAELLISQQGTVDSTMVLESSGHPTLDSAAIAQASVLRFEPAEQGGEPVQVWGRLPVIFPPADELESDERTP